MARSSSFFCIVSCAISLHAADRSQHVSLQEFSDRCEQKFIAMGLPKSIAQVIVRIEKNEAQYNSPIGQEVHSYFEQRTTKAMSHFQDSQEKHEIILQPYLLAAYKWDDDSAVKTLVAFCVKKTH